MYTIYIYCIVPYTYQPTGVWNTAPMDSYHDPQATWIDSSTHAVHHYMIFICHVLPGYHLLVFIICYNYK